MRDTREDPSIATPHRALVLSRRGPGSSSVELSVLLGRRWADACFSLQLLLHPRDVSVRGQRCKHTPGRTHTNPVSNPLVLSSSPFYPKGRFLSL